MINKYFSSAVERFLGLIDKLNFFPTYFQGSTQRFFISKFIKNKNRPAHFEIKSRIIDSFQIIYNYDLEKPRGRPWKERHYSYGYVDSSNETFQVFHRIISEHYDQIKQVLGPNFLVDYPTLWRNTHLPENALNCDVYSQVFHQDSVYDQYNIQVFLLLNSVCIQDGPFEWVSSSDHKKAFAYTKIRNCSKLPPGIKVNRLTGQRGDYLILSTGYTLHRDGVPNLVRQRVMASIALFPAYTKIGRLYERGKEL